MESFQQLGQSLKRPSREEIEAKIFELQTAIETGNWCESLLQFQPWQWLVSESFQKRLEQLNDELGRIDPNDKVEVARLQGEKKGFNAVISRPELFVQQGKEAQAELEEYRNRQSDRQPVTGI